MDQQKPEIENPRPVWKTPRNGVLTESYQYKDKCPLLSESHTRYLTLLPARESKSHLECTLSSTAPEDCPPFVAISYVWGSDRMVSNIYCNSKRIPTTASLDKVLRNLRLPDAKRTLWVDALCINQEDAVEQGHQVAMMGQVYAAAERTVICLGPDTDGHAKAVASLLGEIMQRIELQGGSLTECRGVPQLGSQDALSTDKRWISYSHMVGHDWFSRIWTVQEAALGGNPYILWGSTEIPWARLRCVNDWLLSKARHVWFHLRPWLNDVHGRGFWIAAYPMPNFIETLARAKTLGCKDNRDRIYAFLGSPKALVDQQKQSLLIADYQKDYRKIYHEFAILWLRETGDIQLLSAIEHREDTIGSDTPSWVPRWDVTLSTNYFGLFNSGFDASKNLPPTVPHLTNEDELRVTGMVFDTVIWRSNILPEDKDWQVPGARGSNELSAVWKYIAELRSPSESLPNILALVRTLCCQAYGNDVHEFHPDEAAFALALCRQSSCFGDADEAELEAAAINGNAEALVTHAGIWAGQRSLLLTEAGRYVLASATTQRGDKCCILAGMSVPAVLRPTERVAQYRFVGEAFILGLMHGEMHDGGANSGTKMQAITLV